MPHTPLIKYASLAELYHIYCENFVASSPIMSVCGCKIYCYEHHFVHAVKLFGPNKQRLYFPDEKTKILAQTTGFGDYEHEERRAERLLRFLKAMQRPEVVSRPKHLVTADRAFIRHVNCSQYPYVVVLARKEGDLLTLCTAEPIRGRNLHRWMEGTILFPNDKSSPKTLQPPEKVAE